MLTGTILEIAGDCGVPCIGLLGQALTVGSNLLSGGDAQANTQRAFKQFHKGSIHYLPRRSILCTDRPTPTIEKLKTQKDEN